MTPAVETPARLATGALAELRTFTNPERKAHTEGYFPSAMENLGVAVPDLRRVVRRLARELKARPASDVLALVRGMLKQRTLEGRQVAYEVLAGHAEAREALDRATLEELGQGMDNWTAAGSVPENTTKSSDERISPVRRSDA